MNASRSTGPAALVLALAETLGQERAALATLAEAFRRQLAALRAGDRTAHAHATADAADAVATLGRVGTARDRQARLLARVLGLAEAPLAALVEALEAPEAGWLSAAHAAVRDEAAEVRSRAAALDFALRHAAHLGQELIRAMQVPAGPCLYDASGQAAPGPARRALVNRVG